MKSFFTNTLFFWAEKGKKIGTNRIKLKRLLFPTYRWFCKVQYKCFGSVYLYHVELPVTQKCTLRCRDCSFMMPYFEHPRDYDAIDLLEYMDRLFECVDVIQIFRILGGEPFLYEDLDLIIEKALTSNKIRTVDVITNGTLIPSEKVLHAMKNARLTVQISDYGDYSYKKEEVQRVCHDNGIKCVVRRVAQKNWSTQGDLHFRSRTNKELESQLRRCSGICRSFQNGKLYFCPRASFGALLGIPDPPHDCVDFTCKGSVQELRRQIFDLNMRRAFVACNYCDAGTDACMPIQPAIQTKDFQQIKKWRETIGKKDGSKR